MKNKPRLRFLLGATAAFALVSLHAGCATGATPAAQTRVRVKEKAAVFGKLTAQQQNNIMGGAIEQGDTPDMVYMALGNPRKIVTSADGTKVMWVYVEYYAANSTAITSANNPNALYSEGMTMNDPHERSPDNQNLPKTPLPRSGGAFMHPQAFGSAAISGPMQSLNLPDLASNTVYVFFHHDKVVEIKMDGDAATQTSSHQPPTGKKGLKSPAERKV